MKRTRVALALALAPFVLLTGCGNTTAPAAPSAAPPAAATTDSSTAAPTPSTAVPTGSPSTPPRDGLKPPTSTKEVEVKRTADGSALVTGARFAEHEGFDRVVIDLKGNAPGYSVRWVPELVQDGSGDPIDVKGGAYLQVTITPANAHSDSGSTTWSGGPVFQAELGNVQNVVKTGDFEGMVGVGIVLDHKAAFRVLEQKNPQRLIVDVAH
ncbi:hypothetical protein [Streptosporangium sp. NPDC051022]|uniref:AMIN-like domain-containing (lipo)protein n=1 Tax=Streptosporangium sp. NPDC051022 TaxID=3155752 RepID=UPI00344AD99B